MATLTRKEMEKVILSGGTVLYDGKIIGNINTLPTEADLAGTDPVSIKNAESNIDDQIKALLEQKQKLAKAKESDASKTEEAPEKAQKPRNTEEASQQAAPLPSTEVGTKETDAPKEAPKATPSPKAADKK